jgi:DNA-binding transcriptional MerR regulator
MRTVKEVSRLTGVTVRALHHYDEIGLLRPSERSASGYRLYAHADLVRLQEIIAWQQLGFSLRELRALLDDPAYDRRAALHRQRELAELQRRRYAAMVRSLDAALAASLAGRAQEEETMFDGFDAEQYAEEAERVWGETAAYRESRRRLAGYGKRELDQLSAEAAAIEEAFAACLAEGGDPAGEAALALAELHRQHISRWFYDCTPEIQRGLGELFVADGRFRAHWERRRAGLAEFVSAAFLANGAAPGAPGRGSA